MKDTIDLKSIVRILMDKILWILASAIVLGAAAYAYSEFAMVPTYTASTKMYVQGSSLGEDTLSSSDVSIRLRIVPAYQEKLNSNDYRELLYKKLGEDGVKVTSEHQVQIYIGTNEEVMDVLYISVNTTDPELSYLICEKITEITPETVVSMYPGFTLEKLDSARVPSSPASPNVQTNTILGILIGIVLSCGVIIVLHMLDNTVRDSERVTEVTKLRFMGEIPDMNETFKGGYSYYKYGPSMNKQGGRK